MSRLTAVTCDSILFGPQSRSVLEVSSHIFNKICMSTQLLPSCEPSFLHSHLLQSLAGQKQIQVVVILRTCIWEVKVKVKVKLSLCSTKYHAMKTYWGVEV